MVKYDLGSGLLIFLIIILIFIFINVGIYMVGMCVLLINFLISGYVVRNCFIKSRVWIILVIYFFRMGFIILIILFFVKNI